MIIFLSSTCYDLLDVRFELFAFLREWGAIVKASDIDESDFEIVRSVNSIETCLVNVRDADIFIIILDKRYGSSLEKQGFGNFSATHLEYKEAREKKKPIFMYVRDRFDADHTVYKNHENKPGRLSWVTNEKDWRLFEIYEEHIDLVRTAGTTNWRTTFTTSIELKRKLAHDLRDQLGQALLHKELERLRLPLMLPKDVGFDSVGTNRSPHYVCKAEFTNAGSSIALNAVFSVVATVQEKDLVLIDECALGHPDVRDVKRVEKKTLLSLAEVSESAFSVIVNIDYDTLFGIKVQDLWNLQYRICPQGTRSSKAKRIELVDLSYAGKKCVGRTFTTHSE
jgi:hypothetical protein